MDRECYTLVLSLGAASAKYESTKHPLRPRFCWVGEVESSSFSCMVVEEKNTVQVLLLELYAWMNIEP